MKVKLLIGRAGTFGAQNAGDVVEVSTGEAERMVEAGQAELIRAAKPEKAVSRTKPEKASK